MSGRAFLDTNVLVYFFDHSEPSKQQRAKEVMESAKPGELVLSTQVLGEFYVTSTRKLTPPLSPDRAEQALALYGLLPVVTIDVPLVNSAIEIGRSAQISYWDGLVVAAAARTGCGRLLTEDLNDGQEIASVRVENPFRDLD